MNKKEAAKYLNRSERTIERLTTAGKLHPTHKQGKFGVEAHYSKKELDAIKQEQGKPAPKPQPPSSVSIAKQARREELIAVSVAVAQAVVAALKPEHQSPCINSRKAEGATSEGELINLGVKVARKRRQHWAAELKRTGVSMTKVIVDALSAQFGEPE